jgi:prepilin-type processing-associated H-X9-DG protein
VKNEQVTQCPSEQQAMDILTMFSGFGGACLNTPRYTSYSTNLDLFTNGYARTVTVIPLAAVNLPADTAMLYDGDVIADQSQPVQARHSETFGVAYVDGHVKAIKAIPTGTTTPQFTTKGTGKAIKPYTIGQGGGFYAGKIEARGIPR